MPTTIYYSAYESERTRHQVTLACEYDLSEASDIEQIAELCADDWHDNHDGFEAKWPRVFAIFIDKTGPCFARFEVVREYEPTFCATPV